MSLPWLLLFVVLTLSASAQRPVPPALHPDPSGALKGYRENLMRLRQDHPNQRELPDLKFFMFGMGDRLKLIYRRGRLLNALTGNIEEQWSVKEEIIVPSEYLVHLTLTDGQTIQIQENETGVWLLQTAKKPKLIPGTRTRLNLPRFVSQPFGPVLRVLHQEILINVINGRPVPNFLVYPKPRYRDAALMALVLQETKNLPLIHDWIMAIRDPFDRTEPGSTEVDNPGEVLFLVSLVADKTHPVVATVLDSVARFRKRNYIDGKTTNGDHAVFETKWLKYGLKALGLPDSYTIPDQSDSYSSLFWLDYKREPGPGKRMDDRLGNTQPYLIWAEDHFFTGTGNNKTEGVAKHGMVATVDYPLSWEQQASQAHYPGMTVLDKGLVKQKLAFPHAWHAAEMFLLLNAQ